MPTGKSYFYFLIGSSFPKFLWTYLCYRTLIFVLISIFRATVWEYRLLSLFISKAASVLFIFLRSPFKIISSWVRSIFVTWGFKWFAFLVFYSFPQSLCLVLLSIFANLVFWLFQRQREVPLYCFWILQDRSMIFWRVLKRHRKKHSPCCMGECQNIYYNL